MKHLFAAFGLLALSTSAFAVECDVTQIVNGQTNTQRFSEVAIETPVRIDARTTFNVRSIRTSPDSYDEFVEVTRTGGIACRHDFIFENQAFVGVAADCGTLKVRCIY